MLMRVLLSISILSCYTVSIAQTSTRTLGNKSYEVSNHLSNVMAVVNDRKAPTPEIISTTIAFNETDIKAFNDYYPYGMLLDNRNGNSDYRYGFQGQEKDDEVKGKNKSINYKYRVHDPRLGRFFAVDPLSEKYPYYSSYQFSGNKTIYRVELEGLEDGPIENSNNGANQKGGTSLNTFTHGSLSTSTTGISLNYKLKPLTSYKYSPVVNLSNTASLYTLKNGLAKTGFSNNISLGIGWDKKDKKGNARYTFLYASEFRIYTGHFSKESNISGSLNFSWTWRNSNHALTIGNDFFAPSIGFNGDTGKLTDFRTDGGLTMYLNYSWMNKDNSSGIAFKLYGFTPHRIYDENGKSKEKNGELSDWGGAGVFKTNMYDGAFQSVGTVNRIFTLYNYKISLGTGIQGRSVGKSGQDAIHKFFNMGQFKGWENVDDKFYFEMSILYNFLK